MERMLSHFEAGTSASPSSEDPQQQQLRAQKLALNLLSRGVRLPQNLLDIVHNGVKRLHQVRFPPLRLHNLDL